MAVKWAKNLPSFASLAFRDQVIQLKFILFKDLKVFYVHLGNIAGRVLVSSVFVECNTMVHAFGHLKLCTFFSV